MRRLRRAHQRQARQNNRFKRRVVTAGTAAVITLGGLSINKAPAANAMDNHLLAVPEDADADLLADKEELAIGYDPDNRDQNRNGILDGTELAKRCGALIAQLPWQEDAEPGEAYKWHTAQRGIETCEICGETVNMGPAGIVNPKLDLSVDCPLIGLHYMEHGSFSYAGDVHNGRVDVAALMQVLELRFPCDPTKHQLRVEGDADADLLANKEEVTIGYDPENADQNRNGILDGVELAKRCAALIKALPEFWPEPHPPSTNELHKIAYVAAGLETCDICAETANMGYLEIVNPKLGLTAYASFIALHYMEHGSFSYAGDVHNGRVDVATLVQVLELPLLNEPDEHQLRVTQDADADFLADKEELAIGYLVFNGDQNRNAIADGAELAKRCEQVIAQLPWKEDVTDPDQTYKWCELQFGLETCDICGETVNMGPAGIVNPKLDVEVDCPLIAMHYMEHGSFSYAGDVHNARIDVAALSRALELRFPCDPNEHQLTLTESDLDGDLLSDREELAAGYNLHDADQDDDLTPDGIELAKQCAEVMDALPVYEPNTPGLTEPYKVSFMLRGLEFCDVCGKSANMGYWQVVNPTLGLSLDVPDIVCHYMRHGSFSYSGDLHGKGRTDVALLAKILEMPRRCGHLGTLYVPGDLNKDCKSDLADLAKLAEKWLDSTDPNKAEQKE